MELEGRPLVLNLAPRHETAVRLLGAGIRGSRRAHSSSVRSLG